MGRRRRSHERLGPSHVILENRLITTITNPTTSYPRSNNIGTSTIIIIVNGIRSSISSITNLRTTISYELDRRTYRPFPPRRQPCLPPTTHHGNRPHIT